jgi:hypothetical protein
MASPLGSEIGADDVSRAFIPTTKAQPNTIIPFTKEQWNQCFSPIDRGLLLNLGEPGEIFHRDSLLIPYCRFSVRFSQNLYERGVPLKRAEERMWELIDLELQVLRCLARGWNIWGKPRKSNPRAIRFHALNGLVLGETVLGSGSGSGDPMDVVKMFLIKFYYFHCVSMPSMCLFLENPFDYSALLK